MRTSSTSAAVRRRFYCVLLLLPLLAAALQAAPLPHAELRLAADLRRLHSFSRELQVQAREMAALQDSVGAKERGHFTSNEHDSIESLLFRYLACRESLWDMIDFYRDYKEHFGEPVAQTKGFLIGFSAALHLYYYSATLIATFLDEPLVITKLNEAYYRSEIPDGTYDKLFRSVTSVEHIQALRAAWELFREESADPGSTLKRVTAADSEYARLARGIGRLYAGTDARVQHILEARSLLLPEVRNRLRHSVVMALAQRSKEMFEDNLYAVRGIVFVNISRLKSPLANLIEFSPGQVRRMKSMLQPGDIILTFTAGYMSNIFLPGQFKHGITYVGTPDQRRGAGLTSENLADVPAGRLPQLTSNLAQARLASGEPADVIEAVAEGVIFNSLDYLLHTHINRLAVLRPRLSKDDLAQGLKTVFSLLGNGYDFKFDFNDASWHCCTEVIYRALHERGPIRFPLTQRMGRQTLSADDIAAQYVAAADKPFDLVLLAEENLASTRHRAVILTGAKAQKRLRQLMQTARAE